MYLVDYIAYGLHLWYKIYIFKEIYRKPIFQHPGLGSTLNRQYLLKLAVSAVHNKPPHRAIYICNYLSPEIARMMDQMCKNIRGADKYISNHNASSAAGLFSGAPIEDG